MRQYFAAVCKRGHTVDDRVFDVDQRLYHDPQRYGEARVEKVPNFCPYCGGPVIVKCESCGTPMPGFSGMTVVGQTPNPFCRECGSPFPWATREQRIESLYNLLDFEEGLDEADRLKVIEAIAVMSKPEPEPGDEGKLVDAAATMRRLAPKAWGTAQPVLTNVLSAWVRQKLGIP